VEFILRSGSIDSRYTGRNRLEEGARIHRKLQKTEGYQAEVHLAITETHAGIGFTVEGRADGIIVTEDSVTVDEIKSTLTPLELIDSEYASIFRIPGETSAQDPQTQSQPRIHWAQAMCYGHMYCAKNDPGTIDIQLTYYEMETGGIKRFTHTFTANELRLFFAALLEKYATWVHIENDWKETATASMKELKFPFENYRESQRNLAVAVFRTIEGRKRLFAMAPTRRTCLTNASCAGKRRYFFQRR